MPEKEPTQQAAEATEAYEVGAEHVRSGQRVFSMGSGEDDGDTAEPTRRNEAVQGGTDATIRFVIVLAAGVAAILGAKMGAGNAELAMGAAGALMALYIGLVLRDPPAVRGNDVVDSVYYLGFLYTLVSVGTSLYVAGTGDTAAVVSDFGVAIVSTIIGMAGRIMLTMKSGGATDSMEDQLRGSLQEAGEKLQMQIRYAVADFEAFREELRKRYSDHFGAVDGFGAEMRQAAEAGQRHADELAKLAEARLVTRKEMTATVGQFLDHLKRITTAVSARATVIDEAGKQLDQFVNVAEQVGERWKRYAGQFENAAQPAIRAMETAVRKIGGVDLGNEVRRHLEGSESLQAMAEKSRKDAAELQKLGRAMAQALEDIRASNRTLVTQAQNARKDEWSAARFREGAGRNERTRAERTQESAGTRTTRRQEKTSRTVLVAAALTPPTVAGLLYGLYLILR